MNPPGWPKLEESYCAARRLLSASPGHAHLLGIGGVGMAALAVQLQGRGYLVSGCDIRMSRVTQHLEELGIATKVGHSPEHVTRNLQFVVRSPAVHELEPELVEARALGLPIFARGIMLAALLRNRASVAVAGSHGKTTTTAMLAHILRESGCAAGFAIGGEINGAGIVSEFSENGPLVVEADESDGTLSVYEAEHAIITNLELDHVDFFQTEAALHACFRRFVERTRGGVRYCADDPGARAVAADHPGAHAFGFSEDAELRATNYRETGMSTSVTVERVGRSLGKMTLNIPGRTNVLNALGALGMAMELGISFEPASAALATFSSVRRRFQIVAHARGRTVVLDYAHHPTEIRALMEQAKKLGGRRILMVYQPHRFTRTVALAASFPASFEGVDELVLTPVYAASEPPVAGGTSADLLPHFTTHPPNVSLAHSLLEAWEMIRNKWREGDVLLIVGAGDVEKIATWAAEELDTQLK